MRLATVLFLASTLIACGASGSAPAPTATPNIPATATAELPTIPTPDGTVTLAAVGDVMLARDLTTLMEEHGAAYPYERVAELLMDADLTIANLEVALTERGEPVEKLFNFRAPPRFAAGLPEAGIDIVSLGNNHIADYGTPGIEDTLLALDQVGVRYSGAGMDEAEARAPAVVQADGLNIAFLSYTDQQINTFAGPGQPGVAFAGANAIAQDVHAARELADLVVVSLHSGFEYSDEPSDAQKEQSRAAIDAGAALVLGHHAHTLQGWEWYGAGLIVYGLGNFVFDLDAGDLANLGARAFQSIVLYVTLDEGGVVDARAEPVAIDVEENRPRPATAGEAAIIMERLEQLHALVEP